MTRIIARTRPLCNRQPLPRLSTPFNQPTTATTPRRSRSSATSHSAKLAERRPSRSRRGFFFCLRAIMAPLLKTTAAAPLRSPMFVMHEKPSCRRARRSWNNFRSNFPLPHLLLYAIRDLFNKETALGQAELITFAWWRCLKMKIKVRSKPEYFSFKFIFYLFVNSLLNEINVLIVSYAMDLFVRRKTRLVWDSEMNYECEWMNANKNE